jgi:ABC-type uncharacterized transport system substrate-binding protein
MKIILSTLLFIMVFQALLSAHPHVRLYAKLEFEYNNNRCNGFWVEWKFDDYFSASVIHEFDKDKNSVFTDNEIESIYKKAFINLKNYGYFIFLRKGKIRQHPKNIQKFNAWQRDNILYYRFYVTLNGLNYGNDFYVAVFDRTFYCDIKYPELPVSIEQINGKMPLYEVAINKKYPIYYNSLGALDDMQIYKKWKPGLQTAYPEEIHLFFK